MIIRRMLRGALSIILAVILLLVSVQLFMCTFRNDLNHATSYVIERFGPECAKRGLDPKKFEGPIFQDNVGYAYTFMWKGRSDDVGDFYAAVSYTPFSVDFFYVEK